MMESYLDILEQSLVKKTEVLREISDYNNAQEKLFNKEAVSLEELDENMSGKDELIRKLSKLDEGFETLYARIKDQLLDRKDDYAVQIRRIQGLISKVTEQSVSIQAQEVRNKKLIEDYFTGERQKIRQGRRTSKAAYGYYKNMSNTNVAPPQFLDQKN